MANQILYGDLQAGSLILTGSNGISVTATGSTTGSTVVLLTQYASGSVGNTVAGFGIQNTYAGAISSFYPVPYGAVTYTIAAVGAFTSKRTEYLAAGGSLDKISEHNRTSTKEFIRGNQNFVSKRYVLTGTTVGAQNVYLNIPDIPADTFVEMSDQESWNFTVRIIARKTDALASDAFFIQGFCDNYGAGTINGQIAQPMEIGSNRLAPALGANIEFDQNGGANNYFRIQCQSADAGTVSWLGYIDVVATYASASARPEGPGQI